MQLPDLNPKFYQKSGSGIRFVATLAEADGVQFRCPCGQHRTNLPLLPRDPRGWTVVSGETLQNLTLSPSILNYYPGLQPCWHGFIENGQIRTC